MPSLRDVLTAAPVTTGPDTTITQAAARMVRHRVGSLLVREHGAVVGILTERDVLRAAGAGSDLLATKVRDWMTRDPTTAPVTQDVEEAEATMLAEGFRHLPVTDDGEVVGVVSIRDLLGPHRGAEPHRDHEETAAAATVSDPAPETSPAPVQRRRTRMHEAIRELQRCAHDDDVDEERWRSDLAASVARLDDVVSAHIAETEGADGFFEELVRESSGRLSAAVGRLRRDHERSSELVRELGSAIAAHADPATLRQEADELFAQLEAHRHRGSDLLWQAYGVEIGVGD